MRSRASSSVCPWPPRRYRATSSRARTAWVMSSSITGGTISFTRIFGCWRAAATGYSLVATRYWLLAAGFSLLASGRRSSIESKNQKARRHEPPARSLLLNLPTDRVRELRRRRRPPEVVRPDDPGGQYAIERGAYSRTPLAFAD